MKPAPQAIRCRKKFLRFFPRGFRDPKYVDWERGYKWEAHEKWMAALAKPEFQRMLRAREFSEIARTAVTIESRTNLLFSFEKMALRDGVKSPAGAKNFSEGLFDFLHSGGSDKSRFDAWRDTVADLPRKQTRVLTWPLLTVFGFLAQPEEHIFLKPNVTRAAAKEYAYDFEYVSRPNWDTYTSMLGFADRVRRDNKDLKPADMMDLQSFIWVQGSDEYKE